MAEAQATATATAPAAQQGFNRDRRNNKRQPRERYGRAGGEDKVWIPCTKLGRLVKDQKITSLESIFLFSMPIKEYQIVDTLIAEGQLQEHNMGLFSVQKATSAGQRTRFKAYIVMGDGNGHIGIGSRVGKEASPALQASLIAAKLNIVPVRRGYWGNKIGEPHTIPMKVTGKCGSVSVRLVPAPRGTGLVAAPVPKKMLEFAGVQDVYTSSSGKTRTRGNFIMATFYALRKTYGFLTPDLWPETAEMLEPTDEFSDSLAAASL